MDRQVCLQSREVHEKARTFDPREGIMEVTETPLLPEGVPPLRKQLCGFRENRMAVTFFYEWHDDSGQWYRKLSDELWEFTPSGPMARRLASIKDAAISEGESSCSPSAAAFSARRASQGHSHRTPLSQSRR